MNQTTADANQWRHFESGEGQLAGRAAFALGRAGPPSAQAFRMEARAGRACRLPTCQAAGGAA